MKRALLVVAVICVTGCYTHLSKNFGQAYRSDFRAQIIDPNAGTKAKPDQGLDPEEAAVVAARYRKTLEGKKAEDQEDHRTPVILMPSKGSAP